MVGAGDIDICRHDSLEELADDWQALQADGFCSFFQTYQWTRAWHDTIGKARRINPCIVCGRDADGQLVFILPFAVEKRAGGMVLRWYGADEITYGMGIFDKEFLRQNPGFFKVEWQHILAVVGRVDAINLEHQPERLDEFENPLRFLFNVRSANQTYRMTLCSDYQNLYEQKRSASSRRGARKRDKKLLQSGTVRLELPERGLPTVQLLSTMINQQQDRLGSRGVRSVYDETRRAFLLELGRVLPSSGNTCLLPYHLTIDGTVCAVMLGGCFQSTYWAMISTLTSDPALLPLSPGDYALRATIKAACERGLARFDFAAGDTDYKNHWCDEVVALHECNMPVTVRGRFVAGLASIATRLKRQIKNTPWLFALAKSARKLLLKKRL